MRILRKNENQWEELTGEEFEAVEKELLSKEWECISEDGLKIVLNTDDEVDFAIPNAPQIEARHMLRFLNALRDKGREACANLRYPDDPIRSNIYALGWRDAFGFAEQWFIKHDGREWGRQ